MDTIKRIQTLAGLSESFVSEPTPYSQLVEEFAHKMHASVWDLAQEFVSEAQLRGLKPTDVDTSHPIKMADESDPIQRLVELLQEAGFNGH